jgi:polysaccharide export outer membrane protein
MKQALQVFITVLLLSLAFLSASYAENKPVPEQAVSVPQVKAEYIVGVDDVMDISILQPEKMLITVTVAPDGTINVPYIGSQEVKGMTLSAIQDDIQKKLADGYMKYPVVAVFLKESRSMKFFVYGEVIKPGTYLIDENTTVLKAISLAGGFTKFGSSSRVKVLRPNPNKAGYQTIKVNIKAIVDGAKADDIQLKPGDIVVVSEGVF